MKKVTNLLILLLTTYTISFAQVTPASSTDPRGIKVEKNMIIKIPTGQDMVYVYEIDAQALKFKSADDRERYFSGIKDDVVSYRMDRENDKLYLVLDRDYIEKNKWTAAEINDHLSKRAQFWKENYDTYDKPEDKK